MVENWADLSVCMLDEKLASLMAAVSAVYLEMVVVEMMVGRKANLSVDLLVIVRG